MRLAYKLWLDNKGKAFGKGPYEILAQVEKFGSLRKASASINMSYSQIWKLIKTLEKRLGFLLLRRRTGGFLGGGSFLTPQARKLMHKYKAFESEADILLQRLYEKHFGG